MKNSFNFRKNEYGRHGNNYSDMQCNNGETIAMVEEQSDRKKAKALAEKWNHLKDHNN